MAVVVSGSGLTIEDIEAVARRGETVELHPDARERIVRCRAFLESRIDAREIQWELDGLLAEYRRVTKTRDSALANRQVAEAQLAKLEMDRIELRTQLLEHRIRHLEIKSPIDGVVVSESVDVGQFVSMGSRLALVYGTDGVEVRVPLDIREMAWFDVPARDGGVGSLAEVSASFGGTISTWPARIVRLEAQVDEASRMVHVVAEVARPYDTSAGRPALLPGTFVDVSIFGRTLEGVAEVPRFAVHESNQIWVYENGSMAIREVEIVRANRESALVGKGLEHEDLVIVTSLDAVTDGMTVRIANGETGASVPPDGGEQDAGQKAATESAIQDEGNPGGAA